MDATRSVTMLGCEAIAWRPWRRRVSRVMTRSSVPAAIRLPDWISTTWVSSGRSSQQALILASCEVSSAMTTLEPESDRMWWTSSVPVVGYTVVVAAPEQRIPRSDRIHSSRVLDAIATRSSDSMPSEIRPAAISVTAEEVWVQVKDSHSFLALRRRNASALPLPSTRCRNIAASEAGASAADLLEVRELLRRRGAARVALRRGRCRRLGRGHRDLLVLLDRAAEGRASLGGRVRPCGWNTTTRPTRAHGAPRGSSDGASDPDSSSVTSRSVRTWPAR